MSDAVTFLRALWPTVPPGPRGDARIQLWDLATKRSTYYKAIAGVHVGEGARDLYTAAGLAASDLGAGRRARSEQVVAIPGLWIDYDLHDDLTLDDLHAWAAALAPPTLTVHTGGGLHAWWLLGEPWAFTSLDEQSAAADLVWRWQHAHRTLRPDRRLDSTHDLARLMRLPGTLNAKREPHRPVTLHSTDGPRHTIDKLTDLCAHVTAPRPTAVPAAALGAVDLSAPADVRELIALLLEESPEFAARWHHTPARRGWSLSEWDMSIATLLAASRSLDDTGPAYSDAQIAAVLTAHRAHHDPQGTKGRRHDYLARTVARARVSAEAHSDAARRRQIIERLRPPHWKQAA